jgi:RND family efflux transporter MFP subunit
VEEVAVTSYSEVVTAIGTSRARRSIVVTAEVDGQVAEADLVANRLVAQGDVLLRLVSDLEEIEVSIAETELENARQTLERYTTLNSASDGTVAGMTVQEAETAVALAEANLARARHARDALTIRAPISGRLGLTDLLPGGRIAAEAEIVTIDDTSRIVVSFELPERAIELLEVGREVQATTPALAGQVLVATVTAFDSRIDETTRTVTVEAEIDNAEGRLWPGMSFSVSIPNDSEPLPQVPATALAWTAEGARVWAVRDGLAAAVPVIVRMRQGEATWVEGDLSDGERVVLDGEARLREGSPVVTEEPATGAEGEPSQGRREGSAPQEAGADAAGRATGASGQTSRAGGAG